VCQLDSLTKCLSRGALRRALKDLPPTLDATYERIRTSIEPEYSVYSLQILRWLTFSARPLLVEEVAEALAIDVNRNPAFDREEVLEDPLDALKICSSLVTIATEQESSSERAFDLESVDSHSSPKRKILLLAHYSVNEYLISKLICQRKVARYSIQSVTYNEFIA
jgi:hypothetical protein